MEDHGQISDDDIGKGKGTDKDSEVDGAAEARRILNSLVASRSLYLPWFLSFAFCLVIVVLFRLFCRSYLVFCLHLLLSFDLSSSLCLPVFLFWV
jgi:hypothetical protein